MKPMSNALTLPELREFYDPAELHTKDQEQDMVFFDRVASTRYSAIVHGLGRLTGHEVIWDEAIQMLYDPEDDSVELPIDAERKKEIYWHASGYAEKVAASILEEADGLVMDRDRVPQLNTQVRLNTLPNKVVLTGKVMAAVAHDGVFRRNGRDYISHPSDVASILSAAWRRSVPDGHEQELDLLSFLAYTHDGPEDSIDAYGRYIGRTVVITPLVTKKLLLMQGIPEADEIAKTQFLLMRTRDTEGYRMEYLDYVKRGLNAADPLWKHFLYTKTADITHNANIEPDPLVLDDEKIQHKLDKKLTYELAQRELLEAAERLDAPFTLLPHRILAVTKEVLQRERTKESSFDAKVVAKSVRERVMGKLAA